MKAKLERHVSFFERQWPWMLVALVVLATLASIVGVGASGLLEKLDDVRFGPNVRGYTAAGILLGLLSVFFVVLTLWYSVKKRRTTGGTSMMAWLWAHVYLGLLAIAAAVLHAGLGVVSASISSGKVLFLLFAVIVASGIVWRLMYAVVPPRAAAQVLNYSKQGALHRAEEVLLEIEKLVAGKSTALQQVKDRLLVRDPTAPELHQMAGMLPPEERPLLDELVQLGASRQRALRRPPLQAAFTRRLQMWRVLHVPLAFAFLFALVFHVIGAFDLPRKVVPLGVATDGPFAAYRSSEDCKDCHTAIYKQWSESMHASALTSPLTIVQNNLDMKHTLAKTASPDPRRMCINCHGPAVAALIDGDTLPLRDDRQKEGVECVSCHQLPDPVTPGGGALARLYQDNMIRGDRYLGRLESPVGNAFHRSARSPLWDEPERLCATCHDVNYDKNGDGRIVKGVDLVLQQTFDEYREYRKAGGRSTCIDCHMPVVPKLAAAADGASVPFTMDYTPADRKIHDHGFVGVDYRLDLVSKKDPQKARRAALLASAAAFTIEQSRVEGQNLVVRLTIENTSGHNLPTGFAFARQMWIELVAKDAGQATIFSSGVINKPDDDLCDAATFGDAANPLKPFVVGCGEADPHLVNVQLKLVDKIAALADPSGQPVLDEVGEHVLIQSHEAHGETYLQHLTGGAVARVRPIDKATLAPLRQGQRRTYQYTIPLKAAKSGTFTARLLFRNLPPYWVRAMAAEQKAHEQPRLETLVPNIQTVEMAKVAGSFTR